MIPTIDLTGDNVDLSFASNPDLATLLASIESLWRGNQLPKQDLTTFRPENRDALLTLEELERLKLVYDDVNVAQAARALTVTVPDNLRTSLEAVLTSHFPVGVSAFSGSLWYRPGGFMTWHTNSSGTGHRMYMTCAAEAGKSFFRYQNNATGEIMTSPDTLGWQFRIFKIGRDNKFWHCVSSDTNRLSLGVQIGPFGDLPA